MDDERFKGIATDPRFRPLPSRFRKVKIDQRFKGMFTDKKFKVKSTVDERGRPVKLSSNKHLKKFYELSSEEESEDEEKDDKDVSAQSDDNDVSAQSDDDKDVSTQSKDKSSTAAEDVKDKTRKRKKKISKKEEENGTDGESQSEEEEREINPMEDYARGLVMMSSSSDDDSDDEEGAELPYDQEAHDDHYWGEQDEDAESTEEATHRLAIQNMDWDRIKAYDLLMLLNSFKPATGSVNSVKIYPSEYGKAKMKEDDVTGPKELKSSMLNEEGEASGRLKSLPEKDQKKAMLENLRQYQLNRLKYYYAVAEFDSAETANHVYTQCDGQEYLASCTQLDLRFIPDDMDFAEEELKDSANHVPDKHEPKFFINPALGQSLVRCTWDENAPDRYDILNKKYKLEDLEELDVKAYLASASDEEDEVTKKQEKKKKNKMKKKPKKTDEPKGEIDEDNSPDDEDNSPDLIGEENSADLIGGENSADMIGGGSSDEEAADEKSIAMYRQLLLGGLDKHKAKSDEVDSDEAVDLEITWDTGLKDTAEDILKKKTKSRRKKGEEGEMSVFAREREKKREKAKLLKQEKKRSERAELEPKKKTKEKKRKEKRAKPEAVEESPAQAFSDDEVPDGFNVADLMDSDDAGEIHTSSKREKEKGGKAKKKRNKAKSTSEQAGAEVVPGDDGAAGDDLDLMLSSLGGGSKKHFNIKEIAEYDNMSKSKRKRKLKQNQLKQIDDDFQIDVKDDRFNALYSSHLYNIDPSSQDYRKTKSMDAIIDEKQRRIQNSERVIDKPIKRKHSDYAGETTVSSKPGKLKSSISSLVKSVKAKTQIHSVKHKKAKYSLH